jgi:hypothetical protein
MAEPKFAKLKITCDGPGGYNSRVWRNDQEISRFTSAVDVHLGAEDVNTATLRILVDSLEMDAELQAMVKSYVVEEVYGGSPALQMTELIDPTDPKFTD